MNRNLSVVFGKRNNKVDKMIKIYQNPSPKTPEDKQRFRDRVMAVRNRQHQVVEAYGKKLTVLQIAAFTDIILVVHSSDPESNKWIISPLYMEADGLFVFMDNDKSKPVVIRKKL